MKIFGAIVLLILSGSWQKSGVHLEDGRVSRVTLSRVVRRSPSIHRDRRPGNGGDVGMVVGGRH